jgi:tetratricopeptide (TPR) repeat protein
MEDIARSANELVASEYYQQGLDTGNPRKFTLAANYYAILLVDSPSSDNALKWRLQIANAKYFAGNLGEAERGYSELIAGLKTPEEILLTAHYQRVLTLEKIWRTEFESAVQKSQDISKNQRILSNLSNLEDAVEEHATRFPAQSRSIDLLIVAASANRDQDRFTQAGRFWQRVLISNPSPGQRSIAVRGLIFNKIRAGKPAEIIESATNFLKFEQADSMTGGLRQELLGVLATAANDESTRLVKRGQSDEAGTILLQAVSDFDDLPHREKFWRDGAYFLAISGNWARAQASAENFLTENFREFSGDMKYLLARAHEYQLRFSQSVKSYIDLAEADPTHPRAVTSLERAEKLALADNNFFMAGRAAQDLASHLKETPDRLAKLDAAIDYYMQGSAFAKARQTAEARLKNSHSVVEKLKSELALGRIRYQSGDVQVAIDDLDTLSKQIDRAKPELGNSYRRLASETNMILGEHALKLFQNTKLNGLKSNAAAQVDRKSRIFTDLTERLDKVARLEVADFSPKARFLVAQSATIFADEISSIPSRNGEPATLRNQTRFNQNVNHLRDLAQKYHGSNILAKQRSPQSFIRNEWIGKSAIALSNMSSSERSTRSVNIDQLSTASSSDLPQQWSH